MVPAIDGVAVVIVGINLLGALALGVLLEALVRSGPDEGRRRAIRLFVGTGVLGGFTTYSTLAVTTAGLLGEGRAAVGLGYALGSVILGALATTLGIVIGGAWHRRARVAAPSNQPARSTGERG
nr:CrcB family protein [Galbitalea soli]